jgi:hypothetical protein
VTIVVGLRLGIETGVIVTSGSCWVTVGEVTPLFDVFAEVSLNSDEDKIIFESISKRLPLPLVPSLRR